MLAHLQENGNHVMSNNTSRLDRLWPVIRMDLDNNTQIRIPLPLLFSNITMLWKILEIIVDDWKREVNPLQNKINKASNENERYFFTSESFLNLQPYYLKCLFSYVAIFFSLINSYDRFNEQLNELNKEEFLRVKHSKKPNYTNYIKKVKNIRDLSVAHPASRKVKSINSNQALIWQPLTLGGKIGEKMNLNSISFGDARLIQKDLAGNPIDKADDFKINGILELNENCMSYIDEYDRVCANYLTDIQSRLPKIIANKKYFVISFNNKLD